MNELDTKINKQFAGMVVRKDLVSLVKGNAIVPSYVLEYLLGQYCATADEDSIQSGIDTVKGILSRHYVHRNEAGLIRSTIRERGRHKVIDKVQVHLNDKRDVYEATFANLGIKQVLVDVDTIKRHPKLLVSGVWCISDLEYLHSEDKEVSPWLLGSLKPIQLSRFDFEGYVAARRQFTTDEWIDLLMQSIGFDPEFFGRRGKLLQLTRLVPFCERNYNLIELGPKGTGKSHVYSEFSPHGMLLSGGEVTVAKLFVNNATGRIGLVGYWDVVAFDEFAGKKKRVDKALVDILKNFMANKSFSRGIETLGAEASMAFVGNTQHTVPYMLKHSDLFDALPDKFHDSAFLDRIYFYVPGWEVDIIRGEMFSDGYGFVVDYLAEILRHFRNLDYSHHVAEHFELSETISTRDKTGILKTFSGLMKIVYPHGEASSAEIEELLRFSMEGRKRVKDQLLRIDATYTPVDFVYTHKLTRKLQTVRTLEEQMYPSQYHHEESEVLPSAADILPVVGQNDEVTGSTLQEGHHVFVENQQGISYDDLFGPYLVGAKRIVVTDPYIRLFYQARNLMEFLETVVKCKSAEDKVVVHLETVEDEFNGALQNGYFKQMMISAEAVGITFTWEYNDTYSIHARHIVTDTGWKVLLDRGLDIFQRFEMNDTFSFANRVQKMRAVKAFEVTYLSLT
ncbi:MAG: BREX system Lon protease-like protein BrxL [Candidatus Promineifilaceae bacterium]